MGMEERIKELMEAQHMNQQLFADFLGISSATLSSIFSKRTKVTLNTVRAIKEKLPNLNYSWLLDGVGPMFRDDKSNGANGSSTPSAAPTGEGLIDFDGEGAVANDPSMNSASSAQASSGLASGANGSASSYSPSNNPSSAANGGNNYRPNPNVVTPKIINNIRRNVASILVIYDDQTCETFVPKK